MPGVSKYPRPLAEVRTLPFSTTDRFNARRIRLVLDFLADNYSEDVSLARMSEVINISSSRLSRLFKAQMGISPMQYLKLLRLERAKELLLTTCSSVKEVMFRVGLTDASHFVRDFRRVYGLTPGQHRAKPLLDLDSESQAAESSRACGLGD